MSHRIAGALLLLLLATGNAAAQRDTSRLDPALRFTLRQARAGRLPPATGRDHALLGGPAALAGGAGARQLHVLVHLGPGGEAALRAAGARIRAHAGDVVTAVVPLAAFPGLVAAPGIRFLEAATTLRSPALAAAAPFPPGLALLSGDPLPVPAPANDRSIQEIDADRLRVRVGDHFAGLAGQGILVGIFDSGLDLRHPDFLDGEGRTRVLYAWDQTETDGQPPGIIGADDFDYGVECDSARINAGGCPLRDRVGHGTHVAGTLAGDGSATGNGLAPYRFTGVAPEANLIVVKGGDTGYTSDQLLDGVAYIMARAQQLGRPLVINLSLGTQSGPHDGTTLLERGLDSFTGPGRIIVTVAGNQGNNQNESPPFVRQSLHAMGRATGTAITHELVVPNYTPAPGEVNDGALLELWYDGRDALAVTVVAPGGEDSLRAVPGDSAFTDTPSGAIYIDNASAGVQETNGDRVALITLFDAEATRPPVPGTWRIRVQQLAGTGTGDYHLWFVGSTLATATDLPTLAGTGVTNAYLVSTPGNASGLITVGAFAGRHDWLGPGSQPQEYPFREQLGDLAHFSGPGPTRDGRLEPVITAPGKVVVSARSVDATLWQQLPTFIEADGVHAVLLGTSMAAPQVAGVIALLLQLQPTLTTGEARQLIETSAAADAFTAHSFDGAPDQRPNQSWGYGKLDAGAAVRLLSPPPGALDIAAAALPPPAGDVLGARGQRLSLLRLRLAADSVEPIDVQSLTFQLAGQDSAARVLLVEDRNANGSADTDEPVVAALITRLDATPRLVTFTPGPVLAPGSADTLLLAVELSGAAPNLATFQATYLPAQTRAAGSISGALRQLTGPTIPVSSATIQTTVLTADQRFSLSANPVRGDVLIVSYREPPRYAAIYTVGGARVRTLDLTETGRTIWRLDNAAGSPVTSGMYLLVLDFPDEQVVRKILVLRHR